MTPEDSLKYLQDIVTDPELSDRTKIRACAFVLEVMTR